MIAKGNRMYLHLVVLMMEGERNLYDKEVLGEGALV
jgi:hypothetical protein